MIEQVGAGGRSASASSGTGWWCGCTPGAGVGGRPARRDPVGTADVRRPGVDEVQLEVVAGEHPGELGADVAEAEDADHRGYGDRVEEER